MEKKQELPEATQKQLEATQKRLEAFAENVQKAIDNIPKFELPIIKQSEALAKQLQEFGKAITLKYGILENDYNDFINQYTPYFIKNGIITPKDFKQFFNWLASCKYPYESFGMVEICENDFLHFHEYKEILFNNRNWSEEEERERLESKESNTIEIEQASTNLTDKQQSKYSNLTVLQWGAIFHYADTTNLLPKSKTKIAKLTAFIEKHKIETTLNHLKTQYYKANNQINKYNNYPIDKLEEIIPFLKQHYKQTVERVKNDIELLQEYKDEYE